MNKKIITALNMIFALMILLTACLTELPEVEVTVTFNTQGGNIIDPVVLIKGETLGSKLITPERDEDEFHGWFNGYDEFTADTIINIDIELTAKWKIPETVETDKIKVTFSTPEAVPSETIIDVTIGKALGPIFPVDPRRQGFWFEGWKIDDTPFTKETIITEDITITADWRAKGQHTVTFQVPTLHQASNPGIHNMQFQVYDGDGINEWAKRFPAEMNTAAPPNANQYHQFFRWSVGGTATGLVYNERTPITENVTLTAFFGLYFNPRTFEIDLSTRMVTTPNPTPNTAVTRTPAAQNIVYDAATGVTATFHAAPAFIYFQTPQELRNLLALANVNNETQVRFEVEYVFENPSRETPNNLFNFMIANVRQGDNWNATAVRDLTLDEINNGIGEMTTTGEIHDLAGTHSNHSGANRNWLVVRGGRGSVIADDGPFRITFKSIKVHLVQ